MKVFAKLRVGSLIGRMNRILVVVSSILLTISVECSPVSEPESYGESACDNDPFNVFMPKPRVSLNSTTELKVINGYQATPHAYPYQVGIEIAVTGGWTWCGGAIISDEFVLTAAHCVDQAFYVFVIFGAHDRLNESEPGRIRMFVPAPNLNWHKAWTPSTLTNDIAAIKLPSKINFSTTIQPITLPSRAYVSSSFEGTTAVTTGWGYLKGSSGLSRYLQYAEVVIMNINQCKLYLRQVVPTHICIDGSYGKGVCYGDSGGPIVSTAGPKFLIGITSFVSAAGCEINYPSVYTRVTSFLDWITANTGIAIY